MPTRRERNTAKGASNTVKTPTLPLHLHYEEEFHGKRYTRIARIRFVARIADGDDATNFEDEHFDTLEAAIAWCDKRSPFARVPQPPPADGDWYQHGGTHPDTFERYYHDNALTGTVRRFARHDGDGIETSAVYEIVVRDAVGRRLQTVITKTDDCLHAMARCDAIVREHLQREEETVV